jgi:hypothetical protein
MPMHLIRYLLLLLPLLGAPALAQSYYYQLTGLSAGSCTGTSGAVQLSGATITRSAYLPAGDHENASMTSSTGGFAIGNTSYSFSIGPTGPASTGNFQSGITTTPGQEPVTVNITVSSNAAPTVRAQVVCAAALATPQFSVIASGPDEAPGARIPTLQPGALLLLSLLLGLAAWIAQKRSARRA